MRKNSWKYNVLLAIGIIIYLALMVFYALDIKNKLLKNLPSSEQNPEECDATDDASSTIAGLIKIKLV